ncbi:hypothetical protein F5I97DRAFT_711191 [Phlebopus sp. FC_14]|nr:hypothetical protein F5I97DRAFT_711191 [Phlebopus sp. FC_14]
MNLAVAIWRFLSPCRSHLPPSPRPCNYLTLTIGELFELGWNVTTSIPPHHSPFSRSCVRSRGCCHNLYNHAISSIVVAWGFSHSKLARRI